MYAKLSQQLGMNVRAARHRTGHSQARVAEAMHVPTRVLSRLERGGPRPSRPTRVGLCEVLRVSGDFILRGKALDVPATGGAGP